MGLLSVETVVEYTANQLLALGADNPFPRGSILTAHEIEGGNVNFAFCVKAESGQCVFVKQAPDFVKVFGPDFKLSRERMVLEVSVYSEWESQLSKDVVANFLPRIYTFDLDNMAFIMEFLGSYTLLQESLYAGNANRGVAAKIGEAMGLIHAKTHCTRITVSEVERLTKAFHNSDLRGIQLEHVFSKPFRESDRAAHLRKDSAFMGQLESIKAKYRGENRSDLALLHGDLHPGSVMADDSAGVVKIIDPEFAIYGPPGLDVGSLISGYVLAYLFLARAKNDASGSITKAISQVWTSYTSAMEANGVTSDILSGIAEDAVCFASCEVARTSLGFAGVRALPFSDRALKADADAEALALAYRWIMNREGKGLALILEELAAKLC